MARALLVFVDGIGFGRPGPQNPFDGTPLEVLGPLAGHPCQIDGVELVAVDATLGHAGLPQSATGQAAIFTGVDAVALSGGHHRSGYPTPTLRGLIQREGFLGKARARGQRGEFLNAYDRGRAEQIARVLEGKAPPSRRHPPSSSSVAALANGGSLATFDDARRGRAATFDLTGELLRAAGIDAPVVSIKQAALAVAAGAAEADLSLFEMFLTDSAGHAQDTEWARDEAVRTDRFLVELMAAIDPREQLVVVTSDHGNLEDLSVRTHTRAPVPLLAFGAGAGAFVAGAKSLLDVAPRRLAAAAE
jgi:2,3-bisphosphoglycerate-independent phosphoglycerate mutase